MYANNKHLTLDQRNIIEQGLNEDLSLIQISKKLTKTLGQFLKKLNIWLKKIEPFIFVVQNVKIKAQLHAKGLLNFLIKEQAGTI